MPATAGLARLGGSQTQRVGSAMPRLRDDIWLSVKLTVFVYGFMVATIAVP